MTSAELSHAGPSFSAALISFRRFSCRGINLFLVSCSWAAMYSVASIDCLVRNLVTSVCLVGSRMVSLSRSKDIRSRRAMTPGLISVSSLQHLCCKYGGRVSSGVRSKSERIFKARSCLSTTVPKPPRTEPCKVRSFCPSPERASDRHHAGGLSSSFGTKVSNASTNLTKISGRAGLSPPRGMPEQASWTHQSPTNYKTASTWKQISPVLSVMKSRRGFKYLGPGNLWIPVEALTKYSHDKLSAPSHSPTRHNNRRASSAANDKPLAADSRTEVHWSTSAGRNRPVFDDWIRVS